MTSADKAVLAKERAVIEGYLDEHGLEDALNCAVNAVVKERPDDPYLELGERLLKSSATAKTIAGVSSREILTHDGSAFEIVVWTSRGAFTAAAKGPLEDLSDKLIGLDVTRQDLVDAALDDVPAHARLAASVACCKAGARHSDLTVAEHIAQLCGGSSMALPMPGICAFEDPDVMVVPKEASTVREALDAARDLLARIPEAAEAAGFAAPRVGARGGYCVDLTATDRLKLLEDAAARAELTDKLAFALEGYLVADESLEQDGDNDEDAEPPPILYAVRDEKVDYTQLTKLYLGLLSTFAIVTIHDPFYHKDLMAFFHLKEKLDLAGLRASGQVDAADDDPDIKDLDLKPVGGDDTCTLQLGGNRLCNTETDLDTYEDQKTINTLVLTLAKGGSVSGCVDLATKARTRGWGIVVAADTQPDDSFLAHLAVGLRAGQFQAGGLIGCSLANYNELLRLAASDTPFVGSRYRADAL